MNSSCTDFHHSLLFRSDWLSQKLVAGKLVYCLTCFCEDVLQVFRSVFVLAVSEKGGRGV